MLAHQKAHEAAKKGEADHPVIAARFARKAAKAQPTVAEVFAELIEDKQLGSARKAGKPVRQRTIDVLSESFNGDIKERIGDAKAAKLTREALQACIDAPRKRGAPGAAAHVYRTLRGLMNFATKRGYVVGAVSQRLDVLVPKVVGRLECPHHDIWQEGHIVGSADRGNIAADLGGEHDLFHARGQIKCMAHLLTKFPRRKVGATSVFANAIEVVVSQ